MFTCKKCNLNFESAKSLNLHNVTKHMRGFMINTDTGSNVMFSRIGRGKFSCPTCFNVCHNFDEISEHLFCEVETEEHEIYNKTDKVGVGAEINNKKRKYEFKSTKSESELSDNIQDSENVGKYEFIFTNSIDSLCVTVPSDSTEIPKVNYFPSSGLIPDYSNHDIISSFESHDTLSGSEFDSSNTKLMANVSPFSILFSSLNPNSDSHSTTYSRSKIHPISHQIIGSSTYPIDELLAEISTSSDIKNSTSSTDREAALRQHQILLNIVREFMQNDEVDVMMTKLQNIPTEFQEGYRFTEFSYSIPRKLRPLERWKKCFKRLIEAGLIRVNDRKRIKRVF